jgi:hypothetical protein
MKTPGTPPHESEPASEAKQSSGNARRVVALKLYIARSTPNSVRAEQNLDTALEAVRMEDVVFDMEVIDVFTNGKRAILDNVIVTPTLIVAKGGKSQTIVGDLSDTMLLISMLTP